MDITKMNEKQIEMIADRAYPKKVKKDIDGEWYDANKYKKQAFKEGFKVAMGVQKDW